MFRSRHCDGFALMDSRVRGLLGFMPMPMRLGLVGLGLCFIHRLVWLCRHRRFGVVTRFLCRLCDRFATLLDCRLHLGERSRCESRCYQRHQ